MVERVHDDRAVAPVELAQRPHARLLALEEVLPLLASPDTRAALRLDGEVLADGVNVYPIRGALPLLIPTRLLPYFTDRLEVPFDAGHDSFLQYFLLASIKQSGEINAASDDVHYRRHLFRMNELLSECRGIVLDVGCDDPLVGASLLPAGAGYVGLDPFCTRLDPFRVVGVGEFLPFRSHALDAVVFNTSLDHILDWRRAIEEAGRVLVAGGKLYISTLVWTARAGLITDAVHFHHFREYEIFGALAEFGIESVRRYDYKGDAHRHGLYLCASKRGH